MNAIEEIDAAYQTQIDADGKHPRHIDNGSLAMAAACYAAPQPICIFGGYYKLIGYETHLLYGWHDPWPWDASLDYRNERDRIQQLITAGALIVAEIDRLKLLEVDHARST